MCDSHGEAHAGAGGLYFYLMLNIGHEAVWRCGQVCRYAHEETVMEKLMLAQVSRSIG